MVTLGVKMLEAIAPLCSKFSIESGKISCHQSIYSFELSNPNIICPAQSPIPLSELPTGIDGLLHNAHCPLKETIKEMIIIKYFKTLPFYRFPYNERNILYYI